MTKKILVLMAVVFVILLSSCKTSEECPKAYSDLTTSAITE